MSERLYKQVDLKDGEYLQYVGIYALKWQQEWGMPEIGFVEVEDRADFLSRLEGVVKELDVAFDEDCRFDLRDMVLDMINTAFPELEQK